MDQRDDTPQPPDGVRFGRTLIQATTGDLLARQTEAVVIAANRRGVLGAAALAGRAGLRSLGGSEIERAAMAQAPLELGTAIATDATGLDAGHVRAVLHAVVHRELGDRARLEDVRRAVPAALLLADRRRLRSVALPLLGVEGEPADADRFVAGTVEELVAALRRSTLGIDRVVVVCRFEDHAAAVLLALGRARERVWVRPA